MSDDIKKNNNNLVAIKFNFVAVIINSDLNLLKIFFIFSLYPYVFMSKTEFLIQNTEEK